MRELTFKSYLMRQMGELSGIKSSSLYRFAALSENNARLKDAMTLYMVLFVKEDLSNHLLVKYPYFTEGVKNLSDVSIKDDNDYPSEYRTIYENYKNQINKKRNEDKIKLMMQKRIVDIQKEKGISNYRIYKTLNLNPGNVNAFLKNNDVKKLGLNTVRRILGFVNSFAEQRTIPNTKVG